VGENSHLKKSKLTGVNKNNCPSQNSYKKLAVLNHCKIKIHYFYCERASPPLNEQNQAYTKNNLTLIFYHRSYRQTRNFADESNLTRANACKPQA